MSSPNCYLQLVKNWGIHNDMVTSTRSCCRLAQNVLLLFSQNSVNISAKASRAYLKKNYYIFKKCLSASGVSLDKSVWSGLEQMTEWQHHSGKVCLAGKTLTMTMMHAEHYTPLHTHSSLSCLSCLMMTLVPGVRVGWDEVVGGHVVAEDATSCDFWGRGGRWSLLASVIVHVLWSSFGWRCDWLAQLPCCTGLSRLACWMLDPWGDQGWLCSASRYLWWSPYIVEPRYVKWSTTLSGIPVIWKLSGESDVAQSWAITSVLPVLTWKPKIGRDLRWCPRCAA